MEKRKERTKPDTGPLHPLGTIFGKKLYLETADVGMIDMVSKYLISASNTEQRVVEEILEEIDNDFIPAIYQSYLSDVIKRRYTFECNMYRSPDNSPKTIGTTNPSLVPNSIDRWRRSRSDLRNKD